LELKKTVLLYGNAVFFLSKSVYEINRVVLEAGTMLVWLRDRVVFISFETIMLTFDILTIFPEIIAPYTKESLLRRAQEKGLLKIEAHNLRDWADDKHKTVDEKPFGGGLGMVMKIEPFYKAAMELLGKTSGQKSKVVFFTPRGKKFTQKLAHQYAKLDHLIFICGRYEGVDERITKIADDKISIGEYDLMGGELPALIVVEAVSRLIPGVIGKPEFLPAHIPVGRGRGGRGFIEYPQYTRPEIFETPDGKKWRVPKVLVSGDHKKIAEWRKEHGKLIEG